MVYLFVLVQVIYMSNEKGIIQTALSSLGQWWAAKGLVVPETLTLNSLAPGRYGTNFKSVISQHMLQITFLSTSHESALMWI